MRRTEQLFYNYLLDLEKENSFYNKLLWFFIILIGVILSLSIKSTSPPMLKNILIMVIILGSIINSVRSGIKIKLIHEDYNKKAKQLISDNLITEYGYRFNELYNVVRWILRDNPEIKLPNNILPLIRDEHKNLFYEVETNNLYYQLGNEPVFQINLLNKDFYLLEESNFYLILLDDLYSIFRNEFFEKDMLNFIENKILDKDNNPKEA